MQVESKKVFGLGFSKTGTTSLEKAFSILGYKVCAGHFNNNYTNFLLSLYVNGDVKELIKFTGLFDAFADGPWGGGNIYKNLVEVYPDAHYILTVRDPENWYKSFEKMITRFDSDHEKAFDAFYQNGRYGTPYFFKHIFQIESLSGAKEKMINYYINYNNEIIDYFKSIQKPLLVVNITEGDGWEKICPFLGKPIPENSFPHENPANSGSDKKSDHPRNKSGLIASIIKKVIK